MRGEDWIDFGIAEGADLQGPGIYRWTIGVQCYIGKATRLRSRLDEYIRNVEKLGTGRPYRKSNPNGFRRIHHALYEARRSGQRVGWDVLCVSEPGEALLANERDHIARLRPVLNGPLRQRHD